MTKTSESLILGSSYTRKQLREMFSIRDATINTGIFKPRGFDSVWIFLTEQKTPDRTQYRDYFEGELLHFDGQTSGRTDHHILNHAGEENELVVFYRKEKYEFPHAAFRYEGCFKLVSASGSSPKHFILERTTPSEEYTAQCDIEGLQYEEGVFTEGSRQLVLTNRFERNPKLRTAAVRIHGTVCRVCGFDFSAVYGDRGRGYIEAHHLKPLSDAVSAGDVNPETDMTVLCSNCHRMIHRHREHVLSVEELKMLVENSG